MSNNKDCEQIEKQAYSIFDFKKEEDIKVNLIGNLYPKNKLTLLHGLQGSGKSYSVIKSLNEAGVTPIYIAVEDTQGLKELNKHYTDSKMLEKMINHEPFKDITGSVVIVDTYTRLHELLITDGGKKESYMPLMFEDLIKFYNITIIVVGHTAPYVGDNTTFRDNLSLARYAAEELYLMKKEPTATEIKKDPEVKPFYSLHIRKGRGNGGARIITEWMRN